MNTLKITEEEKNRILQKHKNAIKKESVKKETLNKGLQKPN
jgi:hypothetical protein